MQLDFIRRQFREEAELFGDLVLIVSVPNHGRHCYDPVRLKDRLHSVGSASCEFTQIGAGLVGAIPLDYPIQRQGQRKVRPPS